MIKKICILFIVVASIVEEMQAQCSINIPQTPEGFSICYGQQTATITASGVNAYTWTPSSTLSASTGSMVVASPSVTTIYTVTGTTGTCTATNTVVVLVHQIPTVTFTVNIDTINAIWTIYPTYSSNVVGATWYFTFWNIQNIPPYNGTGSYANDTYYGLYPYGTITPPNTGAVTGISSTTIYTVCVTVRDSFGCTDTTGMGMPPPPYTYCQYGNLCTACYYPTTYNWDVTQNPFTAISQTSISNTQISIYPNPTAGILNIEFATLSEYAELSIVNVLGTTVMHQTLRDTQHSFTINLSTFADGVYYLSLKTTDGITTKKVILQH